MCGLEAGPSEQLLLLRKRSTKLAGPGYGVRTVDNATVTFVVTIDSES